MAVLRWVFKDLKTNETWTVTYNPNTMTSPFPARKYTFNGTTAGPAGSTVVYEAKPDPVQWQFGGEILDRNHYEKLLYWSQKKNRIQITDHYGRKIICSFDKFDPVPKRAVNKYWRHTYTCTCTVYGLPTAAPLTGIPS